MAVGQREVADRLGDGRRHELLTEIWRNPPGFFGWWMGVNHRTVGFRYIITAFVFFVIGGIEALIMRWQLAVPENDALGMQTYNEIFTMHGTTMMFLFVVPMVEGLAMYLLALMIGARDLPFPRLNLFGYYTFLIGGIFVYTSFLVGAVPDGGWFAYPPLTSREFSPGTNMDFWLVGVTFVELSAISAAIEIIVGLLKFRAPGMSIDRMPLFGWNLLAVAFMIILAFPALILASLMLEFDRAFGTQFYNSEAGGDPVLWQHLFWVFGHPEVYIQFLPAAGIVSMIVPVFSRRPIVGYIYVALAALAIAFLSFGLWAHHMYTTGALAVMMAMFITVSSMMIAIPNGVQIFSWIATLWSGRPRLGTPLLFVLGFLVLFVIGGVTGVMVASAPFDRQAHDSFFVVAHFHYVLFGGVVFPFFAGFHYWYPKFTGRMLSERLGIATFVTMFVGFNLTFFPLHIVGLLGMPRRIGTYASGLGWDGYNLVATIGAFILASSVLLFIVNVVRSLRAGPPAGPDPWEANSLEWLASSPPDQYNFAIVPRVMSRDPLWDGRDPFEHEPDEDGTPALAEQLAEPYDNRREQLVTTSVDAIPEYAVVLPGNSISPLLLALSAAAIFFGFIIGYWLTIAGIVAAIVVVIAWTWPSEPEGTHERARTPARHEGARSTGWWGMLMFIVFGGGVVVPLVFAYVQIWGVNTQWPPDPHEPPGLLWPAVFSVLLAVSALAVWYGERTEGDRAVRVGFTVALALAVAFLVLQGIQLAGHEFGWTEHAYGSIFYFITGFHFAAVALAVALNAWSQVRSYLGHYASGHRNSVTVAAMWWYFAVAVWFVVLLTVYVLPRFGATPVEFQL